MKLELWNVSYLFGKYSAPRIQKLNEDPLLPWRYLSVPSPHNLFAFLLTYLICKATGSLTEPQAVLKIKSDFLKI